MHLPERSKHHPWHAPAALLTLAAALAACGGGDPPLPGAPDPAAALPLHARQYMTTDQLAWEELVAAPCTVVIDVDAVGSVRAAVALAEQVRWWRGTEGLAFYVRARRTDDAGEATDRLMAAGFGAVFMVI
ncbi:MAG: hypothetical protein KF788_15120 [Piscinibacter sp.]|nr:hypothetical protein [Piscinibacter sp.]